MEIGILIETSEEDLFLMSRLTLGYGMFGHILDTPDWLDHYGVNNIQEELIEENEEFEEEEYLDA